MNATRSSLVPDALDSLEARAADVARLLACLASAPRLLVLCRLAEAGEVRAGDLGAGLGLSPSALSQHLARLRADGLVATRRAGTEIHYRIADPRLLRLMTTLHDLYCREGD